MKKELPLHSARIISITQPVPEIIEELGINSPEGLTAYITRVSNPSNQNNENIGGLLNYCCKHGHWSILEHVYMTVEIYTTRDISAQICRHRSFTFQEFSQRYATTDGFYEPYEIPELRFQDKKNRQKSIPVEKHGLSPIEYELYKESQKQIEDSLDSIYSLYLNLLEQGVAKECARRILPMSSKTKLYMTGNIRSFIFYIKARDSIDGKSQVEHQKVADSIREIFKMQFPIIYKALFKV